MTTKILIGSVLKPVDDVRHYHKIAKSLSKNDVEIHVFGYPSGTSSISDNIIFHPTTKFKRISLTRVFVGLKFFFLGLKIKPQLVITCTHELLKSSFYIKLFRGPKVIYDVQENYYKNIIYTNTFPFLIKYPIAWVVRMNEILSSLMISHYILAEKCYLNELPFINKKNATILENKFNISGQKPEAISQKSEVLNFLITGTLGTHYGTLEGISFFKELNKYKPESTLKVIGISRDGAISQSTHHAQIDSDIKDGPIAYSEIIKVLEKGGVALLPYQSNRSTENRIPTKFYEYLYYGIPMIVQKNTVWETFLSPYKAAIFIDFKNYQIEDVLAQISSFDFYSGKVVGDEILWKFEEEKLLEVVKNI